MSSFLRLRYVAEELWADYHLGLGLRLFPLFLPASSQCHQTLWLSAEPLSYAPSRSCLQAPHIQLSKISADGSRQARGGGHRHEKAASLICETDR